MKKIVIAITAASYSGNKGAAAMLQSSIKQLYKKYGDSLEINLMSVYPEEDEVQKPFDFIHIVSCKPEQLLFIAFPLAILFKLLGWIKPFGKLLCRNKILNAYRNTDFVLDEAGISFVDSRGPVMNTYAFVCGAVPMLLGKKVMKYSQAMGPFHNPINKILAKILLPKMALICARGEITLKNLESIGVTENVKLCADGAFSMEDDEIVAGHIEEVCSKDAFYDKKVAGLSISSVVNKKCAKLGIDYCSEMVQFVKYLNRKGYRVLLIANAARINSTKSRNNDLMVGDAIYEALDDKEMVRWYHEEMSAEEIREYISRCEFVVASRFHAMIGSLEKKVPVLLVGWSHKYKEVLDMFQLGAYAIDYSKLNSSYLESEFEKFESQLSEIKANINKNYDAVIESSKTNIKYVTEIIDDYNDNREERQAEDKKKRKKKIQSACKYVFLVLVVIFMYRFFKRNINDIRDANITINWKTFIVSLCIYFVYKTTQASLWHYITVLDNCAIAHGKAVTTYLYSTLGKYIPGKVFTLAARFPAYDEQGVPMRKVTICFLLENLCTLFGAAFLFVISLFFFPNDIIKDYRYLIVVCIIAFFICINPKIINFFLGILEKITHKKDLVIEINYISMIKIVVLFIFNWIIAGIGFYMLVNSFVPISPSKMLYVGGIFGLAVTVGFFAVFAPSGIGVREAVMIFGFTTMTNLMPAGMAGVVAVVSRLWVSVAELILIAAAAIINKIVKKAEKNKK